MLLGIKFKEFKINYWTFTVYGTTFNCFAFTYFDSLFNNFSHDPSNKITGLGCFHFAHHYFGNRFCFLFL